MGRILTPKYSVEIEPAPSPEWFSRSMYRFTPAAWHSKTYGRPNLLSLAKYVAKFEESTRPGGANEHLGETKIRRATIKRNVPGGEVIATYEAS